ncbi:MAG: MFS transporter [Bacilli bacterium]
MKEVNRFNLFVFLSTFARGMIDTFIPVVLYVKGFSLEYILLFLLIRCFLCLVTNREIINLGKHIKFKGVLIIGSILFGFTYVYLAFMGNSLTELVFIGVLEGLYTAFYWGGRHYYALEVLPSRQLGDEAGNIVIFGQLAIIPAAFIGGLIIDHMTLYSVTFISVVIFLFSIMPLMKIKEDRNKEGKINITKIRKGLPKKAISFFIFDNFKVLGGIFFNIYLFLHVMDKFSYIGLFNIAVGITSMIFVYFFSRKMDHDRKDYLILSSALLGLVWITKVNVELPLLMLIVGFLEGLTVKMHETAAVRNLYALGKQYNAHSYISFYETISQIVRILIILLAFYLKDLRLIIYFCIIGTIIGGIIGFDDGKAEY